MGLLPRLPASATGALSEALAVVQATAIEAVAPIFKAEVEALEDRILRMHTLSYGGGGGSQSMGGAAGDATMAGDQVGDAAPPPSAVVNTSAYIQESVLLITSFRQVMGSLGTWLVLLWARIS